MRTETIAKMVKAGVGQDRAEKFYALFVVRMCGGIEPETGDTFKADEIANAFKDNIPARNALTGALCGEQAPKAKKYKPGRPCTAAEYAEHYDRDPENADLVSDITRATDGKPWVVFKDRFRVAESAKFIAWHMGEDIAPATIGVDGVPGVPGVPVAPVMPGEERRKEAKEYPVDPHTPGGFLDVENKSPRTGADFTGYTDEETQATIMAYLKLSRMDDIGLQRLTEENRGKGAAGILKPWPSLAAAWANAKPENRPKTKATKEKAARNPPVAGGDVAVSVGPIFAASPAANGPTPLVVILGHETKAYASVRQSLVPMERAGVLSLWSEADIRSGFVGEQRAAAYAKAALFIALLDATTLASLGDTLQTLVDTKRRIVPVLSSACLTEYSAVARLKTLCSDRAYRGDEDGVIVAQAVRAILAQRPSPAPAKLEVGDIAAAIISSGLANSRGALLAGLPRSIVAGLAQASSPSDQAHQDVGALQQMGQILDGSRPLVTYLRSAAMLADQRREARVFHDALRALGES